MTTIAGRPAGVPASLAAPPASPPSPPVPRRWRSRLLPTGWPIYALFAGYPVWWALGLSWAVYAVLLPAMVLELATRRRLIIPRGFGLWLLFLLWAFASVVALSGQPPDTLPGDVVGRHIAFAQRGIIYLSMTAVFLYIVNLRPDELPVRKVVNALALLFLATVVGGVLGVLFPRGGFTSPAELLLPSSLTSDAFVKDLISPNFAQVQDVLGYSSPRPAAPFAYSNQWGANFSFLLPFFVVGWLLWGRTWQRRAAPVILLVAAVPVAYSLNRGLWLSLALSAAFLAVTLAAHGKIWALQGLLATLGLVAALFVATPLNDLVTGRLDNPHSNSGRLYLAETAFRGALASPLIGWGGPRASDGNERSITAGPSSTCANCGSPPIGTHGTAYFVMFSNGFVGFGLFVAFFATFFFAQRRQRHPLATVAALLAGLTLVEMLFYNLVPMSLHIVMAGLAVAWRASRERAAGADPAPAPAPAPALRGTHA